MNNSIVVNINNVLSANTNSKILNAIEHKDQVYPVARDFRIPVSIRIPEILDRLLKLRTSWVINSTSPYQCVIEFTNCEDFVIVSTSQRPKYCTLYCQVFTTSIENFRAFEKIIRTEFEKEIVNGIIFSIRWAYASGPGYNSANITELYDDVLIDECYPDLSKKYGNVSNFVHDFLASNESVLILQGPPGSGKTRLIRNILANMGRTRTRDENDSTYKWKISESQDDSDSPVALYTGDKKVLESEEIFADFVDAGESVLVIEDADLMLKPRSDGNEIMHHFLMVADGIIRGNGRKIIFSTNLNNSGDIDPALTRPGRCYGLFNIRYLTKVESRAVVEKLFPGKVIELTKDKYTIAELYNGRF